MPFLSLKSRSIMFLITGLYQGGAETQLVLIGRELMSRGWEPKVVSLISGGPLEADFENLGIPVFTLDMRRGVPDPRGIARLVHLLRRERPAVLHTHMVHATLLGRICRPFAPVPVVVCTGQNIIEGRRWREWAYRATDSLAELTTNVSEAAAARYIRVGAVPARKLKMVPNGVQLEAYRTCPETRMNLRTDLGLGDRFAWLAVGRLEAQKDYPNLLTAMARLRNEHHVLLIAGDGPLRQPIGRLAAELGISEKVRFLGIRKDIPKLMAAADAYVMSSAWEGLPMVLLEASASALPIVSTAVGGNSEIVHDGVNGFLVPANNSEALAEAMRRMENVPPESRRTMGAAGRDHVAKHYGLSAVVDQWEEIYQSLLLRKCEHIRYAQPVSRA